MSKVEQAIRNDPRVDSISDERGGRGDPGDGIWVYLKNGYESGADPFASLHQIHEDTWTACKQAMRYIKVCTRECCTGPKK